ncbi:nitroreductase family protein [Desulfobulbus rhabdoformis]|uniref:nitroreductase family protein n=1 Tax=Desulfobulbus rhabdoformis TaxID=34032 RepID=UPI001962603F|nr:nitroreductase family protein [Desulfobulbus rhabdoformis]MBM9616009.1 nitroreductase family protein [Desulfobulbus rhabdoformis]
MLIDLLRSRRSIRRFTDQPIEQEKLDLLLEAALRSPSSKGFNPWEFVVVREAERIEALSKAKSHGATFLAGAPLVIVVCADTSKSDVWIEDASIATLLVHLEAADLGLGSCWVQLRLRDREDGTSSQDYMRSLLRLPEGVEVLAMVGIGYPEGRKEGHPTTSLLTAQVSYEQFGQKKD